MEDKDCKCHSKQHKNKEKKMNLYASFVKTHYDKSKSFMENSKELSQKYKALKEKAKREV